jgi:AraC-like DNA-binding protein
MDMLQLGGDDLHADAEVQRPANAARRTVGQRSKLLLLQLDPHNSIANATTRWVRLLAGLRYLAEGGSVTDAAHLAGFVDGSHANRACWEMAGWPPSAFARALNDSWMVSPPAV